MMQDNGLRAFNQMVQIISIVFYTVLFFKQYSWRGWWDLYSKHQSVLQWVSPMAWQAFTAPLIFALGRSAR